MNVPILIYHEIFNNRNEYKYAFSREDLSEHLKIIKNDGFHTITADTLISKLSRKSKIEDNLLSITFDDGHISNYDTVLPLLTEFGLKATFFITTDWIGDTDYMGVPEIIKLSKCGMSIQSHAASHNFLDNMPTKRISMEFNDSKKKLENIIGKQVSCISIPGGRYNQSVLQCAQNIGYNAVFTSDAFQFKKFANMYIIGRVGIRYPFTLTALRKILRPSWPLIFRHKINIRSKRMIRKIIGGNAYYHLWKLIVRK